MQTKRSSGSVMLSSPSNAASLAHRNVCNVPRLAVPTGVWFRHRLLKHRSVTSYLPNHISLRACLCLPDWGHSSVSYGSTTNSDSLLVFSNTNTFSIVCNLVSSNPGKNTEASMPGMPSPLMTVVKSCMHATRFSRLAGRSEYWVASNVICTANGCAAGRMDDTARANVVLCRIVWFPILFL